MKRILHIDDESEIREILGAYLASLGYDMISVATPTEAFRTVERTPPDLVICDLQLNEGDGLQVIDRLKSTLPNVPVIVLTGVLLTPQVSAATLGKRGVTYLEKTMPLQRIVDEIAALTK